MLTDCVNQEIETHKLKVSSTCNMYRARYSVRSGTGNIGKDVTCRTLNSLTFDLRRACAACKYASAPDTSNMNSVPRPSLRAQACHPWYTTFVPQAVVVVETLAELQSRPINASRHSTCQDQGILTFRPINEQRALLFSPPFRQDCLRRKNSNGIVTSMPPTR